MTIAIEVGANNGKDTLHLSNDHQTVYAFEPNPSLYDGLAQKFKDKPGVHIMPFAISDVNGIQKFNVSHEGDRGIGSLYDFHPDLKESVLGKHAVFRQPPAYQASTLTMRLDTFLQDFASFGVYDMIDYLHIDAQGSDFNAIKSLGAFAAKVKEGQCEATFQVPIYEDTENTRDNVEHLLERLGFKTEIMKTHQDNSEVDIRFWRE